MGVIFKKDFKLKAQSSWKVRKRDSTVGMKGKTKIKELYVNTYIWTSLLFYEFMMFHIG